MSVPKKTKKRIATAWLHTMYYERGCGNNKKLTFSKDNPFGTPGVNYSAEYRVISVPLYKDK